MIEAAPIGDFQYGDPVRLGKCLATTHPETSLLRELGSLEDEKMISTPTSFQYFFGGRVATVQKKIRKVFAYDAISNLSMFVRSLLLNMVSKRSRKS